MKKNTRCALCGETNSIRIVASKDWNIWKCIVCQNARTMPFPNTHNYQNENFHSQFADYFEYNLPYEWEKSLKMQESMMRKYVSINSKVLEIGCGEGIFLTYLKNKSWQNLTGIEPSKEACKNAKHKKLFVINDYFPSNRIKGNFDVVVASQVLEHIKKPQLFLKFVKKICPKGYLLLTQTNYQGLIPKIERQNWYAWVPEQHYWHFSSEGVKNLIEDLNMNVVITKYSSLVHNNFLSRIFSIINNRYGDQMHILIKIND